MARKRISRSRRQDLELANEGSGSERLQKVLAAAGLGSRRDCETLITEGRVEIDRQLVTELGTKVDPMSQEIRVDGVALPRPKKMYFALNKPPGVLCTNFDPSHRTRVIDLIPTETRVFPVGRLDSGSEGLILVTNDGELANRVTHPRYGLDKTYFVRVAGTPTDEDLLQLRRGIRLAEGFARVVGLKVRKRYSHHTDMEIVLNEGKNREIRRLLAKIGHKVMLLRRTAIGPIRLGDLPLGATRRLLPKEVDTLLEATQRRREKPAKPSGASKETNKESSPPAAKASGQKSSSPKPAKANKERTATSMPEKVIPAASVPAPPKIDLATLLNPSLAPKAPTIVHPATGEAPPAATSAASNVGDVLGYEDDEAASLPGFTPTFQPKKPKRGLEQKLAAEREAHPDFLSPPPSEEKKERKEHVVRARTKKKKFDPGKLPAGRRAEARRSSRKRRK